MRSCNHCDTFGSENTYANQASIPINGRVICVDWCIHRIVAALNAGGVETLASCCGHGRTTGRIDLADGRVLLIASEVPPMCGKCHNTHWPHCGSSAPDVEATKMHSAPGAATETSGSQS